MWCYVKHDVDFPPLGCTRREQSVKKSEMLAPPTRNLGDSMLGFLGVPLSYLSDTWCQKPD